RAHSDRARSASKKGTWLCPPPSWLLQKQPHCYLLSLDPGPTEGLDDFPSQYFRHFHQRESIHHFDGADHIRIESGLVGNRPDEVAWPDPCLLACADIHLDHTCCSPPTTGR